MITDGGAGIAAALSDSEADTAVQRYPVHVQRNVRTYLTSRPRIGTPAQAAAWLGHLNDWYQNHGEPLRARTYRTTTALARAWVRANQSWCFTHDRLRKAYRLLERLSQAETLFTYLRTEFAGLDIAATTNRIEGGTNAQLRLILRAPAG